MNTRHVVTLVAIGLFVALLPSPGSGQIQASLYGRGGVVSPDSYFYETFQNFGTDQPVEWSTASLGRTGMFGLGAQLSWGDGSILVRGEVMRSAKGWVSLSHSTIIPRMFFEPPRIETEWYDIPYNTTWTSIDVVLPVRLKVWRIEPHFGAGVGGKFYSFGEPTSEVDEDATLPQDGFTWAGSLLFGLGAPLSERFSVDLQVRDAISSYWDKYQNDFLFSAAFLWRFH